MLMVTSIVALIVDIRKKRNKPARVYRSMNRSRTKVRMYGAIYSVIWWRLFGSL